MLSSKFTKDEECSVPCCKCSFTNSIIIIIILLLMSRHFHSIPLLSRLIRSCLYFSLSCLFFHTVIVLYGAPLIDSALETFSLAVLLSSLTTLRCLCILGPNFQAWVRVFSRHGAMSVWDTCLQITVAMTVLGAWVGAFAIPLDWGRAWQVWPISCSLGATLGYLSGLVAAPAWIHYHRKQLTYKCK
ncbi:phosphatidylinositol-glycan biosynthesis class F protein isoform X2 [Syngnathoides biaculeatus]|uniref:phosphatidylinositol-glycan biosynthesis class F protein isoform X2 n=1 Tax=Syngnathoides biaculeatus TaxID=300417 RepID=UPI002ADDEE27|nr:phosphatidylinositol-glycan biosynthesis class F protein isoform X2 [Syngnathoides biaculeatus]